MYKRQPTGCGTLVNLDLNGEATGLSNIIISDATGGQIYFEYYSGGGSEPVLGCTDMGACNYDSDATDDDGSCEYPEENFDCDGNCTADLDCAGECAGSATEDECGVCGGDSSSCADCAGVPNGDAVDLGCGCGEPGPSGCDNECGSTAELDECGVCGGDGSSCGGGDEITDGCDLPDSNTTSYLHLTSEGSVLYKSLDVIGGFQFDVDGATINSGSGGDMAANGLNGSAAGVTLSLIHI